MENKQEKAAEKLQKLSKKLGADVVNEYRALSNADLEDKIITLTQSIDDVVETRKADLTRSKLIEDLKAINDGYKDLINAKKQSVELALALLIDRGAR